MLLSEVGVDSLNGSSMVAAILSLAGVLITGLLTALTAIRSGKDRSERATDRRKIEEETTDVILKRVRRELDRAYEAIDIKDGQIRTFTRWLDNNRNRFVALGIQLPDIEPDEGPYLSEDIKHVREEIDRATLDELQSDDLLRRDENE
jgi:hypothetical protein